MEHGNDRRIEESGLTQYHRERQILMRKRTKLEMSIGFCFNQDQKDNIHDMLRHIEMEIEDSHREEEISGSVPR